MYIIISSLDLEKQTQINVFTQYYYSCDWTCFRYFLTSSLSIHKKLSRNIIELLINGDFNCRRIRLHDFTDRELNELMNGGYIKEKDYFGRLIQIYKI